MCFIVLFLKWFILFTNERIPRFCFVLNVILYEMLNEFWELYLFKNQPFLVLFAFKIIILIIFLLIIYSSPSLIYIKVYKKKQTTWIIVNQ